MAIELTRQTVANADRSAATPRLQDQSAAAVKPSDIEAQQPDTLVERQQVEQAKEQEQPTEKSIQDAVRELNQASQQIARNLEFSIDDSSGKTVITVKDRATEEVVRQIPSDEVLQIAERVEQLRGTMEEVSGVLISTQV